MKKIILPALALVGMMLNTACSNDDIEVEKTARLHTLALNVSTQGVYDQFDIAREVTNRFLIPRTNSIAVMTYVYDSQGKLAANATTYLSAFNTATQSFTLAEDTYTAITVETLVNPDVNNESDVWSIADIENMSTIKIRLKENNSASVWDVIGVSTNQISLTNDVAKNVAPAAIGSRINFFPYNFKNSYEIVDGQRVNITAVALGTHVNLDYYSLNPALGSKDKYVKSLSDEGWFSLISSIDAEQSIDPETGDGYYGFGYILDSELELSYYFHLESDANGSWHYYDRNNVTARFSDGATYYAGYYYMGADYFPMSCFYDNSADLNTWKRQCDDMYQEDVTTPTTLFSAPYTNWSVGTVSAVKSYMSGATLIQDIQYDESFSAYTLMYKNSQNVFYEYLFQNATAGLTDSYVVLSGTTVNAVHQELVNNQGYTYTGEYNGSHFFSSGTTSVMVVQSDDAIVVNYYNPQAYTSSPRHEMDKNVVKALLEARPVAASKTGNLRTVHVAPIAKGQVLKAAIK